MPMSSFRCKCAQATFAAACIALATSAAAQKSAGPLPAPMPAAIVAPVDTPYPGTISLQVDASDVYASRDECA